MLKGRGSGENALLHIFDPSGSSSSSVRICAKHEAG